MDSLFDCPAELQDRIARADREDALEKLAGLLLIPEYQANQIRFEVLIHLTLVLAKGDTKMTEPELVQWLGLLEGCPSFRSEDPAEDVFVSSIATDQGNFRVFNGWKRASDFHLQRLLDAAKGSSHTPGDGVSKILALLTLSETIAQRGGLDANLFRRSEPQRHEWSLSLGRLSELGQAVRFSYECLERLHISPSLLDDFALASVENLLESPFDRTELERRPLLKVTGGVRCLLPASLVSAARLFLLEQIGNGAISEAAIWSFHDDLCERWKTRDLPSADAYPIKAPPLPRIGADVYSEEQFFQFDNNKILHLVLLPSVMEPPFKIGIDCDVFAPQLSEMLAQHLRRVAHLAKKALRIDAGMSLVVYSSPGWMPTLVLPDGIDDWFFAASSAESLACLLGTKDFSILRLWKMLRHERDVRRTGTALVMWPDLLVHFSNWRTMRFSFFPQNHKVGEKLGVFPDTSNVIELTRDWRQRFSIHSVKTVDGDWTRCERLDKDAVTLQERTKPVYAETFANLGTLRGVVDTAENRWWLTVPAPPSDEDGRHFIYLLWHTGLDWLFRISRTLSEEISRTTEPIEVELELAPRNADSAGNSIKISRTDNPRRVHMRISQQFVDESQTAGNEGDRAYVRALLEALAISQGLLADERLIAAWQATVIPSSDMKTIHVMEMPLAAFYKPNSRMESVPRFLQDEDLANIEFRFRDELSQVLPEAADHDELYDRKSVNKVLNASVACHWEHVREQLQSFGRPELLKLLFSLIEALHWNRLEWERSARAMLALYPNSNELEDYVANLTSRRDAAFIAYRSLAEMALCHAPMVGRTPGLSDVDILAARCSRLVTTAYVSDACNRELIDAKLSFSANGGLELPLDPLYDLIAEYTHASFTDAFQKHADAYDTYFTVDPTILKGRDFVRLNDALQAEIGISIEELARFHFALDQSAYRSGTHVHCVRQSELIVALKSVDNSITADRFAKVLRAFGLSHRPSWDRVPRGFKSWEFEPWRFERRLSLNLRPIVIASTESDPLIIYGVGQLQRALNYYFFLLDQGWWDPLILASDAAKEYVAERNNQLARDFEWSVLTTLKAQNLDGRRGVSMTEIGGTEQQGDVDVIAWDAVSSTLLVIECKRLKAARTPREVANRLSEFKGESGDRLNRHLERVKWISEHLEEVLTRLSLPKRAWNVRQCVATDHPVPMAYRKGLPVAPGDFKTIRDLRSNAGDLLTVYTGFSR